MEIFFQDPNEIPLPPQEVRIREIKAEPWPDGCRVHVYLEMDAFQKRPNINLLISDAEGKERATVSIIESMTRKIDLTMHLQGSAEGEFTLCAALFYMEEPEGEEKALPQNPIIIEKVEQKFRIEINPEGT